MDGVVIKNIYIFNQTDNFMFTLAQYLPRNATWEVDCGEFCVATIFDEYKEENSVPRDGRANWIVIYYYIV